MIAPAKPSHWWLLALLSVCGPAVVAAAQTNAVAVDRHRLGAESRRSADTPTLPPYTPAGSAETAMTNHTALIRTAVKAGFGLSGFDEQGHPILAAADAADGVHRLTLSTDHVQRLLQLLSGGHGRDTSASPAVAPVLNATIDWDRGSGAYELRRVELSLPGKHVWLVHELDDRAEYSLTGLMYKLRW